MHCKIKCDLNICHKRGWKLPQSRPFHPKVESSECDMMCFVKLLIQWHEQQSTFYPADCVEEFISKEGCAELRINVRPVLSRSPLEVQSHIPRLNAVEQRLIVGQKYISLFSDNMKINNSLYINTIKLLNDVYIIPSVTVWKVLAEVADFSTIIPLWKPLSNSLRSARCIKNSSSSSRKHPSVGVGLIFAILITSNTSMQIVRCILELSEAFHFSLLMARQKKTHHSPLKIHRCIQIIYFHTQNICRFLWLLVFHGMPPCVFFWNITKFYIHFAPTNFVAVLASGKPETDATLLSSVDNKIQSGVQHQSFIHAPIPSTQNHMR